MRSRHPRRGGGKGGEARPLAPLPILQPMTRSLASTAISASERVISISASAMLRLELLLPELDLRARTCRQLGATRPTHRFAAFARRACSEKIRVPLPESVNANELPRTQSAATGLVRSTHDRILRECEPPGNPIGRQHSDLTYSAPGNPRQCKIQGLAIAGVSLAPLGPTSGRTMGQRKIARWSRRHGSDSTDIIARGRPSRGFRRPRTALAFGAQYATICWNTPRTPPAAGSLHHRRAGGGASSGMLASKRRCRCWASLCHPIRWRGEILCIRSSDAERHPGPTFAIGESAPRRRTVAWLIAGTTLLSR